MSISIAITDDHELVLQGIKSMLSDSEEVSVVATYNNAHQTKENIQKSKPEVLLLDINLPDINGIDLSKDLLKKQPGLKIIALTNFEDLSFVRQMLKNGVHGYLLKNTDKVELISAIKAVFTGEIYLQKDVQQRLILKDSKSNSNNGLIPKLTRREQEVLEAIAAELTTREISKKLFISPKTVETHRMNLMSKLGAKNSVGMIRVALEKELL